MSDFICSRASQCTSKSDCAHGISHGHSVACQMSCQCFPEYRECVDVVSFIPADVKNYLNQPMRFRAYDSTKGSFIYWEGVDETPNIVTEHPDRFTAMMYSGEADCHGNYISEGDYISDVQYVENGETVKPSGKFPVIRDGVGFYVKLPTGDKLLSDIDVIHVSISGTFFDALVKS